MPLINYISKTDNSPTAKIKDNFKHRLTFRRQDNQSSILLDKTQLTSACQVFQTEVCAPA